MIKQTLDHAEAVALLQQDCELCAGTASLSQMVQLPGCEHKCCQDCAANFFTIVVTDQNISQAVCPFCREPANLADDDEVLLQFSLHFTLHFYHLPFRVKVALEYYAKLDQILKDILEKDTHDLFQRKLRDRTLMKDPNFKWCYKVSMLSVNTFDTLQQLSYMI